MVYGTGLAVTFESRMLRLDLRASVTVKYTNSELSKL